MEPNRKQPELTLTSAQIHQAIEIYMRHAWITPPSEAASSLLPPEGDFDVENWLMGEMVERDPADSTTQDLRSAAFRLGNTFYPNMKLRMSRPPAAADFLFSVDSHDAILQAAPGSADSAMLEELKANNAKLADAIHAEWDQAGLPTEKNYLRWKIAQAKQKKASESGENEG